MRAGELLARLEDPELDAQLRKMRSALAQADAAIAVSDSQWRAAQAEAQLRRIGLQRSEELYQAQASTAQAREEAHARWQVAEAQVAAAWAQKTAALSARAQLEAELLGLQVQRRHHLIRAPYPGVITLRSISPGQLVNASAAGRATVLFSIARDDRLRVVCWVREEEVARVYKGLRVEVRSASGQRRQALVSRQAAVLDPQSHRLRLEIDLANPDQALLAGQSARVYPEPGR